ncbi:RNase adapter RapZ [Thermopolyspora sp. NPDC052614]|uniref:RapZ C-terminal domain-containing protein n=1 Tax=Thermopolyspora sp. NPDC052614 TaxID=3155682 RepID=UPI003412DF8F
MDHTEITFTHPDVLTRGVTEGWADPETDPTRIDWTERLKHAAIPFAVVDGRPLNPHAPTGIRHGRNQLGHWGEQLCADAVVTATTTDGCRVLLMVERADGHGWALPGGAVDPGETPLRAAVRELAEETGLTFPGIHWQALPARYVPDPRASDEAWMVTVPCRADIGTVDYGAFPHPVPADDASDAAWLPAGNYVALTCFLEEVFGGDVFPAHQQLLKDLLGCPPVEVTSFGYGHAAPPEADIVLDGRRLFRNPHASPAMRAMTGLDPAVYEHVLSTPGVRQVVDHTAACVRELLAATGQSVRVGAGCAGGRHRSVVIARALADELAATGVDVRVHHRDVDKPIIQ